MQITMFERARRPAWPAKTKSANSGEENLQSMQALI